MYFQHLRRINLIDPSAVSRTKQKNMLTSSRTCSQEGGGLEGIPSRPSVDSMIAGTLVSCFCGLFNSPSLSPGVSTELLLVDEFDLDILLNFNLNGATLNEFCKRFLKNLLFMLFMLILFRFKSSFLKKSFDLETSTLTVITNVYNKNTCVRVRVYVCV